MAKNTSDSDTRTRNGPPRGRPFLVLVVGLLLVWPIPLPAGPDLVFVPQNFRVRAQATTPGGTVMFFSVSVEKHGYLKAVKPRLAFSQANQAGIAKQYNVVDVVDTSIWAACDLASQAFTVGSPQGDHQERPVEGSVLLANPGYLTYPGQRLEVVAIRDGQVWHCRALDGGKTDDGSLANEIRMPFKTFEKVGSPGSGAYAPADGDLLIGIDADAMTYFTITIDSGSN